jgi:hypothetical protein
MDMVSSVVMMVTSYLAKRPSVYKYPVVSSCPVEDCLTLTFNSGANSHRDDGNYHVLRLDDYSRCPAHRKLIMKFLQLEKSVSVH